MRNKALRTISLSAALCLGLGSGAALLAQDSTPPPQQDQGAPSQPMHRGPMDPQHEMQHMTKALNLSSDQQSQIMPILQNRSDQMMQMHQDTSMSQSDRMAKMKAMDQDSNAKVEAVLNDQQKAKYEKMMARRRKHMHQMRQDGGAAPAQPGASDPQ